MRTCSAVDGGVMGGGVLSLGEFYVWSKANPNTVFDDKLQRPSSTIFAQ